MEPEMTPQRLVVLSWPRCGTTALGDCLDQTGVVQDLREVFHPRQVDRKQNFFAWRARLFGKQPDASLPHPEQPRRLWQGFLKHLASLSDGRPVQLIDIKVSALHHLDGAFSRPGRKPELLTLLQRMNTPILRIINDQPVKQHLSRLRRFHSQNRTTGAMTICPDDMQNRLESMQQIESWLGHWLDNHSACQSVLASQVMQDNKPSPKCIAAIEALVGQPMPAIETQLRPEDPSKFPPLANRRDLQASFAWTNWSNELEECLDAYADEEIC